MTPAFKVVTKLFVSQFYKVNGGFFLFCFLFLFGIISPGMLLQYHLALIQIEITSSVVLIGVMIAWLLYNEKCIVCFKEIIVKYQNSFLHVLQAMNGRSLHIMLGLCHILVFLPVSIYALIIVGVAVAQHQSVVATLVLFFLVVVTIVNTLRLKRFLLLGIPVRSQSVFGRLYPKSSLINFSFFIVHYILLERKINVLVLKIVSFVFFYLFFIKDIREFSKPWFVICLFLISYTHCFLVYHVHKFVEEKLSFMRNLPLSFFNRITMFFIFICLIFIPELLFMLINGMSVLSVEDVISAYSILITQLLLYTSLLYMKNIKLKEYLQYIFVFFVFFSYVYNIIYIHKIIDQLWLILLHLGVCFATFKMKYFQYEHIVYND